MSYSGDAEGSFDLDRTRNGISLEEGEDMEAVLEFGVHLARRRANLLGRAPTQDDLEYSLSVLCWWRWKTSPAPVVRKHLVEIRTQVARTWNALAELDALVPDSTLRASSATLADWQQQDVSAFLETRTEPTGGSTASA